MQTLGRYVISSGDFESFLCSLLNEKIMSAILAPEAKKERTKIMPIFYTESSQIKNIPISDLIVYSYNLLNSAANTMYQSKRSLTEKIAVIARSCEIRAFIEQHKLRQTNFDNLFLISIDDVGIIDPRQAAKVFKDKKINEEKISFEKLTKDKLIVHMDDGKTHIFEIPKDIQIVDNCCRCDRKIAPFADMSISTFGTFETEKNFVVSVYSKRAMDIVKKINWESKKITAEQEEKYQKQIEAVIQDAKLRLQKDLEEFNKRSDKLDLYNKCTVCGMCVKSCPVCICPVCALTELKKDEKIDPISFLLTRVAHIGDICVNCGKCNLMCPMKIPLSQIFFNLATNLEKEFGYCAGMDKNDVTFHLRAKDVKKEATF